MNPTPTIRTYGPVRHPLRRSVRDVLLVAAALIFFPSTAGWVIDWAVGAAATFAAAAAIAALAVMWAVWWALPAIRDACSDAVAQLDEETPDA